MKWLFLLIPLLIPLTLAACDNTKTTGQQAADIAANTGTVFLVAVAPDGTKLWKVRYYNTAIFFASSGTEYQILHAKTHETVIIPTAP